MSETRPGVCWNPSCRTRLGGKVVSTEKHQGTDKQRTGSQAITCEHEIWAQILKKDTVKVIHIIHPSMIIQTSCMSLVHKITICKVDLRNSANKNP